jgi:hypothetical protein
VCILLANVVMQNFGSYCSYTPTIEQGLLKMHRTIRKADITSEKRSPDVDTAQDEDIQYRSGRLERSSGNTSFHLVNHTSPGAELPPMSLSQAFAATGSYRMELESCRKLSMHALAEQKRAIMSQVIQRLGEEGLRATIDESM